MRALAVFCRGEEGKRLRIEGNQLQPTLQVEELQRDTPEIRGVAVIRFFYERHDVANLAESESWFSDGRDRLPLRVLEIEITDDEEIIEDKLDEKVGYTAQPHQVLGEYFLR